MDMSNTRNSERRCQIISRINDFQLTIASAVEEQTATTSEIVVGGETRGTPEFPGRRVATPYSGVCASPQ